MYVFYLNDSMIHNFSHQETWYFDQGSLNLFLKYFVKKYLLMQFCIYFM